MSLTVPFRRLQAAIVSLLSNAGMLQFNQKSLTDFHVDNPPHLFMYSSRVKCYLHPICLSTSTLRSTFFFDLLIACPLFVSPSSRTLAQFYNKMLRNLYILRSCSSITCIPKLRYLRYWLLIIRGIFVEKWGHGKIKARWLY